VSFVSTRPRLLLRRYPTEKQGSRARSRPTQQLSNSADFTPSKLCRPCFRLILAHCFRPISLLNHPRIQSLRRSSASSVWTVPEASNSQFQIPQSPPRIPERAFTHHSTSPNCNTVLRVSHALHSKLAGVRSHCQPPLSYQTTT